MEKINFEEYRDKMIELGNAMFDYYTGNKLSDEQIMLIANSSAETKILAMDFVVTQNLNKKNYTNYCHNKTSIRILSIKK